MATAPTSQDSQPSIPKKFLIIRQTLDCQQLLTTHPPKFKSANKQLLYHHFIPDLSKAFPLKQSITLSKYNHNNLPLPKHLSNPQQYIDTQFLCKPDVYDYAAPEKEKKGKNDKKTYDFYVNFADANLFGFYQQNLLAQDELQTMEHPILCSIREYMLSVRLESRKKERGVRLSFPPFFCSSPLFCVPLFWGGAPFFFWLGVLYVL